MKTTFSLPSGLAAIWLLACLPQTQAHSWTEQLMVIAPNGTFVGTPGFPRGHVNRAATPWSDDDMSFLVPPNGASNAISPTQAMCQYPTPTQDANRPVLTASAGDNIALRYQENGHVTMPDISGLKPNGSGTVFVYGTTQPSPTDKFLDIHGQWTTDGTGGNGKGKLLATQFFDDGQCYQANGAQISQQRQKQFSHVASSLMGADLWCQNDVQLPANVSGTYTLYWVWDWPTLNTDGSVAKNESYTTCMDINVSQASNKGSKQKVSFQKGQDLNSAAIASELGNPFAAPTQGFQAGSGGSKTGATSAAAQSPVASSSQTQQTKSTQVAGCTNQATVTVTATPAVKTAYITVTVTAGQAEATGTSKTSSTVSPASPASTNSKAQVQPFLNAAGQPASPSSKTATPLANGTAAPSAPKIRGRHSKKHRLPLA